MVFNSLTFLIFYLIVYCLYWLLYDRRKQNVLLLLASYVFYGWWDWRFLSLILFSSLIDYWAGWNIGWSENKRHRRLYLAVSVATNLGLLGFFKYFNFFAGSFTHVASSMGFEATWTTLNIVLPVGISFYTFQTLSYTIDVYRRRCAPHRDLIEFLAFVAFFPQLVAGPIERATNLLRQFAEPRRFDLEKAKDGLRQMLWGFVQKVIVADGVAKYVNQAYAAPTEAGGAVVALATYFFAFQIYCDFAGYSNIAIGCARLLGFDLMRNFAYPYFSRNMAEFWQRWHISLSTWFRDYLYIPLGGNRISLPRTIVNVLITFTVSGLWHGANWTFVCWGLLHGLYFIPVLLRRHVRGKQVSDLQNLPKLGEAVAILATFHLAVLAWVLFRAADMSQVGTIVNTVLHDFDWAFFFRDALRWKLLIFLLICVEWAQRARPHPLEISRLPVPVRWMAYNIVVLLILLLGKMEYNPFIYFQF